VEDAIHGSGILERCPEIELDKVHVGIYGRLVALETLLRDRDRVEIYRPLVVHARDARRQRARERRARAAAAGGVLR
jgi:putative ubiquitin-RnfH superfamily antitoxin RatB of RatAB toxin-antitoxin module